MFALIAFILFILSASGLVVSMLRLNEHVFGNVSDVKLEALLEVFTSFEWVMEMPNDALLLVAAFLIASVLSLGAVFR